MAEHLTLVSLRRALSAQSKVSEKVADDFLNALLGSIQEGLQQSGSVTVNGLGTFKLQDMPARESMNVVTGERFTIAGYKKVVFVAGNSQKTESKSRKAETGGDIDPIRKLGEQAEEIKGILTELGAMTTANNLPVADEQPLVEPKPVEPKPAEPKPVEPEPQPAEPEPDNSEPEEPKPIEPEPLPVVVQDEPQSNEPKSDKQKGQAKPFNPWLTGLITIGVFAMLLIIAYFVLRHRIVTWADGMRSNIEQRVNAKPDANTTTEVQAVIPDEQAGAQKESEEPQPAEPEQTAQPASTTQPALTTAQSYFDDAQRTFTEFQADEVVAQDSRLAWIAKKRYGEKAYWVFIYEANRDKLKNPDQVLAGMQLRIPKLPAELKNPNAPETKALLERLSNKYKSN